MPGFEYYFNSHSHQSLDSEITVVQANPFQETSLHGFFSIGIHPQNATDDIQKVEDWFTAIGPKKNCLAVGEIGLDNRFSNTIQQEQVYVQQLEFAEKFSKPVILHCVNSWERCKFLHSKYAPNTLLIYHGFNKAGIVDEVMNYKNAVISIGTSVLTNTALAEKITRIPINRMLVETDDKPISIIEVYQKIADLNSLTLRDFKDQIDKNAKRIFRL